MKKIKRIIFMMLFILVLVIAGCGITGEKSETQGYILKVENDRVLLAENISIEEYKEIKDLTIEDLSSLEAPLSLIYLSYSKADEFNKGDKVSVTISGGVETSFPGQAKASKIKKVE